jgi:alpha-methylacyl-CoA racemase
MQPLDDVTVVDISLTLPGPYATSILQQLGAEVLSITPPGGDPVDDRGPQLADGHSELFAALNRGKRTLALNLKDERGRELLFDVVSQGDVFVEGFRPGAVDDLGIGPGRLREHNPALVYCSLSGFGQSGPRRDQPAHSLNYEGLAGLLDPDNPGMPQFPVADFAGAQLLVIATLAALRARDRGGGGQYIDLGLYEVLANWNAWNAPWATNAASEHQGDPLVGGEYPCYNTYETADERHLTLGIMEPKFWEELCSRLGREHLTESQFETGGKRGDAYQELQQVFRTEPLATWVDRLSGDLPVAAVTHPADALEDEHGRARDHVFAFDTQTGETVREFGFPVAFAEKYDSTSDDGSDLLTSAGYDDAALSELRESNVVTDDSSVFHSSN